MPARRVGKAVQLPGVDRLLPATEKDWQRTLVEGFEHFGWAVQHVYLMPTKNGGYRTSTTAVGWPDLVCLRREWVVACEVKGIRTAVGPGQIEWLERFAEIPTGRAWMLRPQCDWQAIVRWMAYPLQAPRRFGWGEHTVAHVDDVGV